MRPLGLDVRVGLHTGEVELISEDIAVHIAARIGGLAGAAEVLVSETVKGILASSGIALDRGAHELKGIAEAWLYEVTETTS